MAFDLMNLTTRQFAGAVLIASVAVLGGALISQYWGGLFPCEICLLQRWPWRIAVVVAILVLIVGGRIGARLPAGLLARVFVVGAGISFYHVGVEQHWSAGPSACTASGAD